MSGRFGRFWEGLPPEERRRFGASYAATAMTRGLRTWNAATGEARAIPALLSPLVLDAPVRRGLHAVAEGLVRGLWKLSDAVFVGGVETVDTSRIVAAFSPLEQACVREHAALVGRLATVRVDLFPAADGTYRALEVNATIPAMQGYSDIVAASFIEEVGRASGWDAPRIAAAVDANGSNVADLWASLVAHWQDLGGVGTPGRVAIVARDGDSQLGELCWIRDRFASFGAEVLLVTPDAVTLDRHDRPCANGLPVDLLYRHVFASRIPVTSDLARICRDSRRYRMFNPVDPQLEAKGFLALLQEVAHDDARSRRIGLTSDERAAVLDHVPWSRRVRHDPTTGPDGAPIADLRAWLCANRARVVLKKSWAYGGKSVFLAEMIDQPEVIARVRALTGSDAPVTWERLVDHALSDPSDSWVAQELVAPAATPLLVQEPGAPAPTWQDLYMDLSTYTNLGATFSPSGGAVRAAPSRIVNIATGGGMAPLLREEVARDLFADRPDEGRIPCATPRGA